jgi:hypothetical protein
MISQFSCFKCKSFGLRKIYLSDLVTLVKKLTLLIENMIPPFAKSIKQNQSGDGLI